MNKTDVLKLKAGEWIELWFIDAPNEVVLLLEQPQRNPGTVFLQCAYFTKKGQIEKIYNHTDHSQVVRSWGMIKPPDISSSKEYQKSKSKI